MRKRPLLIVAVALLLALAGGAFAQSTVLLRGGATTNLVAVDSSGRIGVTTSTTTCTSPTHAVTSVGVAAGNTPAAQLASRRFVVICVSAENSGARLVKCRIDGSAPVMGTTNVGDVMGVGDCMVYPIGAAVVPQCISDTASTAVTSLECQ